MAGKSAEPYLPCPGRIVTCRRGGCMQAATDHIVQLCPVHLAAYEHECGRALSIAHRAFPSTPPPAEKAPAELTCPGAPLGAPHLHQALHRPVAT
jgi:hypothetical protein